MPLNNKEIKKVLYPTFCVSPATSLTRYPTNVSRTKSEILPTVPYFIHDFVSPRILFIIKTALEVILEIRSIANISTQLVFLSERRREDRRALGIKIWFTSSFPMLRVCGRFWSLPYCITEEYNILLLFERIKSDKKWRQKELSNGIQVDGIGVVFE